MRERAWSASRTSTGLDLPLGLDRRRLLEIDRMACCPMRRGVHEDAVDRSGSLQSRRGVDDVARRHALARARLRVEGHQRLAGRDPHPELEALLDSEVSNCESRANRSLRVVLVSDRGAEEGHHCVADELLDRAAVVLELPADALVVWA